MINNKIIISFYREKYIFIGFSNDKAECIYAYKELDNKLIPGSIVNARVEKVNEANNSCFVRISKDESGYLEKLYKCESILPVLYKKEPVNNKKALFTDELSLAGSYAICYENGNFVKSSAKLSKKVKESVKEEYQDLANELGIGILIRSLVFDESIEKKYVVEEIRTLAARIKEIRQKSLSRPQYTIFYSPTNQIIKDCENFVKSKESVEILTDSKEVFDLIHDYINKEDFSNSFLSTDQVTLRLYVDNLLPLTKLYAFEKNITDVTSRIVNLRNGSSIVIDKTEALTAIDINSSHFDNKEKDKELFNLELNIQAFREIFNQIELRNISGIIIVDFINMRNEESYNRLSEAINSIIRKAQIKMVFLGFTKLGLGEFSRQKIRGTFAEQLR